MAVIIKGPTTPRPLPHGNNQQSPAIQHLIGTVYGGFGAAPRGKRALGRRKRKAAGSRSNGNRARSASRKKGLSQRKGTRSSAAKRSNGAANRSGGNRRASRPSRLIKGSAAAKRYMASIRPK